MFRYLSIAFTIFCIFIVCPSEDLKNLCNKNSVLKVKNAFNLKDVTFLGLTTNGTTHPIRINGLKFKNNHLISDSVKEWKNWNRRKDSRNLRNSRIDELADFLSAIKFTKSDGKSPLIFIVQDSNSQVNYLMGYEIVYDEKVMTMELANTFHIDPYTPDVKDVFKLSSIYTEFPADFKTKANPIVSFPINDQTLPKRAIVYYYETNPQNKEQHNYKLHIIVEEMRINNISWTHDKASGQCIEINKTTKVDSALAISNYSSDALKKFDLIEFYDNGKYGIKTVSIDSTDIKNTSVTIDSVPVHEGNIKEIINCSQTDMNQISSTASSEISTETFTKISKKTSTKMSTNIKETSDSSSAQSDHSGDDNISETQRPTSRHKNTISAYIYVILVVVIILIIAVITVIFFCLKLNNPFA